MIVSHNQSIRHSRQRPVTLEAAQAVQLLNLVDNHYHYILFLHLAQAVQLLDLVDILLLHLAQAVQLLDLVDILFLHLAQAVQLLDLVDIHQLLLLLLVISNIREKPRSLYGIDYRWFCLALYSLAV